MLNDSEVRSMLEHCLRELEKPPAHLPPWIKRILVLSVRIKKLFKHRNGHLLLSNEAEIQAKIETIRRYVNQCLRLNKEPDRKFLRNLFAAIPDHKLPVSLSGCAMLAGDKRLMTVLSLIELFNEERTSLAIRSLLQKNLSREKDCGRSFIERAWMDLARIMNNAECSKDFQRALIIKTAKRLNASQPDLL